MQAQPTTFQQTPCLRLVGRDGATALVALHGAHVLSWIPADGRERLFLSARAHYGAGTAIRGGIPVIFPQFAGRGALPKHGFARTTPWRLVGVSDRATFELVPGATSAAWPHAFRARLHVGLDAGVLTVALEIENTGAHEFAFSAALHTYLAVTDLDAVALHGLAGRRYEDSTAGGAVRQQTTAELRFNAETDRIYVAPLHPLSLHDGPHRLRIDQHGFADTVVWNPGATLAAGIADLAPGEHRRFLCVEAGQVLEPVHLPPGGRWSGMQRLG
ncbi:D-hexose-6-phosphate mutarotase [Lysobacter yangpyeongensis]|uniref:Putative glucose-6-phosphate 1-epimerase n=1 Tax=Lysobacter yangpyeongensis TaxID=346182 RepID=A0ABW0SMA5_9GAMM